MPYLLAVLFPPAALLWCRRPGQALLNALAMGGLMLLGVSGVVDGAPLLLTVATLALVLWAVRAVDAREAPRRAARRIREAWGPPADRAP